MDDGRSPGVEEVESAEDLPTPAANDLWLWPKPPHVTGGRKTRGGREGGRNGGMEGGDKEVKKSEPVSGMV